MATKITVIDRTIEDKIDGVFGDKQLVSIDIGKEFIKTVFNGKTRLNSYGFFELNGWDNEDIDDIIFVDGVPYLYGKAADLKFKNLAEECIDKRINNEKILNKPVYEHGFDYDFFKVASHQLLIAEMKKAGVDINEEVRLITSIPIIHSKRYYNDFAKHLESFYDHDGQYIHTIRTLLYASQFGVFMEAFRDNNGDSQLSKKLLSNSASGNNTVLSISIGSSSSDFTLFVERDIKSDVVNGWIHGSKFYPHSELCVTLFGKGTLDLFVGSEEKNNFLDFLFDILKNEPDEKGEKNEMFTYKMMKKMNNFVAELLGEISEEAKSAYSGVDAVVVGGGGSVFLTSHIIRNALALDNSVPVIFSKYPLHSCAIGMYYELVYANDNGYFDDFDDEEM